MCCLSDHEPRATQLLRMRESDSVEREMCLVWPRTVLEMSVLVLIVATEQRPIESESTEQRTDEDRRCII